MRNTKLTKLLDRKNRSRERFNRLYSVNYLAKATFDPRQSSQSHGAIDNTRTANFGPGFGRPGLSFSTDGKKVVNRVGTDVGADGLPDLPDYESDVDDHDSMDTGSANLSEDPYFEGDLTKQLDYYKTEGIITDGDISNLMSFVKTLDIPDDWPNVSLEDTYTESNAYKLLLMVCLLGLPLKYIRAFGVLIPVTLKNKLTSLAEKGQSDITKISDNDDMNLRLENRYTNMIDYLNGYHNW